MYYNDDTHYMDDYMANDNDNDKPGLLDAIANGLFGIDKKRERGVWGRRERARQEAERRADARAGQISSTMQDIASKEQEARKKERDEDRRIFFRDRESEFTTTTYERDAQGNPIKEIQKFKPLAKEALARTALLAGLSGKQAESFLKELDKAKSWNMDKLIQSGDVRMHSLPDNQFVRSRMDELDKFLQRGSKPINEQEWYKKIVKAPIIESLRRREQQELKDYQDRLMSGGQELYTEKTQAIRSGISARYGAAEAQFIADQIGKAHSMEMQRLARLEEQVKLGKSVEAADQKLIQSMNMYNIALRNYDKDKGLERSKKALDLTTQQMGVLAGMSRFVTGPQQRPYTMRQPLSLQAATAALGQTEATRRTQIGADAALSGQMLALAGQRERAKTDREIARKRAEGATFADIVGAISNIAGAISNPIGTAANYLTRGDDDNSARRVGP